jgi:hypothetical protein
MKPGAVSNDEIFSFNVKETKVFGIADETALPGKSRSIATPKIFQIQKGK